MTHLRRTTVALLAGTLVLAGTACGGGSKHAKTSTSTTATGKTSTTATGPTSTTATGKTSTTTASGANKPPPLSATPATELKYSGTGVKELGVVRIPKDSTIKWTDDAPAATRLFQIIPASVKVQSPVNSRDASGEAKIRKGAYHGFLVNAVGHWTLDIVPGG
jgi:hypothetical protein